ncbi:TPA: hypothetical protein ACKP7K_004688 [Serratia marcescens]
MTANIKKEDVFLFSRSQNIVESDLIPAGHGDSYDEIMKSLYEQHEKALKNHQNKLATNKILHD